jgi:hypothetical protein
MNILNEWCNLGFQLDTKERKNIFLTGSRVYGTQNEKSDYDIYLIVSDEYYKKISRELKKWNTNFTEDNQCLYFGEYNINLFSHSFFQGKLQQNWLQALMCMDLGKEFVIHEDFVFEYEILYRRLGRSVVGEAGKKFEMARRKWFEWDLYSCKKYIVHAVRDLMLGTQVVKYGKIVDYTEANNLYFEVLALKSDQWKDHEDRFHPVYEKYKNLFEDVAVFKDTNMGIREFLSKFTLQDLRRFFSISIHASDRFMVLRVDGMESPFSHQIVKEADQIVIDRKSGNIKSYPPKYIRHWDDQNADTIQWKTASVILDEGDEFLHVFFHEIEWYATYQSNTTLLSQFIQNYQWIILDLPTEHENFTFTFLIIEPTEFLDVKEKIFIHSIRKGETELDIAPFADKFGWKVKVPLYQSIPNIDFCFWESGTHNPCHSMGYFIQDNQFRRIRINHSQHKSMIAVLKGGNRKFEIIDVFRSLSEEDALGFIHDHPEIKFQIFLDFVSELEEGYKEYLGKIGCKIGDKNSKLDYSNEKQRFYMKMTKQGINEIKTMLKHLRPRDLKKLIIE